MHPPRPATPAALALLAAGATFAPAAPILSLQPVSSSTVTAGQTAAVNLVLGGSWTTAIRSVELDLGPPAGGSGYAAVAPNADGFAESDTLTATLNVTNDGSLLNDPTLAYAAGVGQPGFAAGSGPVVLGTLYLRTPAGVSGDYPLTVPFVEIIDANGNDLPATTSGTVVHATVPEPAALAVVAAGTFLAASRRRRPSL